MGRHTKARTEALRLLDAVNTATDESDDPADRDWLNLLTAAGAAYALLDVADALRLVAQAIEQRPS